VLGDRWSLIVIRDIIFGDPRRYREPLTRSEEGIASNVLADRRKRLLAAGLLTRADDPRHRQSATYSLTEPAIQLPKRDIGRGTGELTRTMLPQGNAHAMIRRRAAAAGIETKRGARGQQNPVDLPLRLDDAARRPQLHRASISKL
jgi:hypothetical protein